MLVIRVSTPQATRPGCCVPYEFLRNYDPW